MIEKIQKTRHFVFIFFTFILFVLVYFSNSGDKTSLESANAYYVNISILDFYRKYNISENIKISKSITIANLPEDGEAFIYTNAPSFDNFAKIKNGVPSVLFEFEKLNVPEIVFVQIFNSEERFNWSYVVGTEEIHVNFPIPKELNNTERVQHVQVNCIWRSKNNSTNEYINQQYNFDYKLI